MKRLVASCLLFGAALGCASACAADAARCQVVNMASPGWTDINATNAVAGIVLEALGYQQKILPLSVPITFAGLRKGQVDVFLGNWMPAQRALVAPLLASGAVEQIAANLPQAKFTLAVPAHVARAGVRTFADLARHAERFDRRIYGIESGAPANQTIKRMLKDRAYGLDGWTLVESSEQGMLSQVKRRNRSAAWIVFLAWEPHQMNNAIDLVYLDGDTSYFGPNYGSASIHTVARRGYRQDCPNAGRLFTQMIFDAPLEHAIIADVAASKEPARAAALRRLRARPELLDAWLTGVRTLGGADGRAAVHAALHVANNR